MEIKASVKKNYIWNASYQILNLIVPLITAPYLSRVLGADGTGVYSYTNSIVSYFTLVAVLGTSTFGQRSIAYVRNDRESLSRSFFEILSFRIFMSLITLIAYGIFVSHTAEYRIYYIIHAINIINVVLDISWFYQGVEEFKKIVIRNLIIRICNTAFVFIFIKNPSDLWLYILSVTGFTALGDISMWSGLRRYICKVSHIKPFRNVKDIILMFLPTIATQVYTVLDKSMIGWITSSTYQNGCYEQAEKISRMALTLVTSAAVVVLPRVANLFKEGDVKRAKDYIYKGYRFTLMLSTVIMFGIIGVSNVFVPVFFGEGYDMAKILMSIFSALVVVVSMAYITGYSFLIATGQQNIYTIAVTVAAIANLLMNILMIPRIGAVGAAIASVLAEIIGLTIQLAYCCVTKQLECRRIFTCAWKYIISGVTMMMFLLFLQNRVSVSIFGLVILIVSGAVWYAILLVVLRDDFFIKNLRQFLSGAKSKIHYS